MSTPQPSMSAIICSASKLACPSVIFGREPMCVWQSKTKCSLPSLSRSIAALLTARRCDLSPRDRAPEPLRPPARAVQLLDGLASEAQREGIVRAYWLVDAQLLAQSAQHLLQALRRAEAVGGPVLEVAIVDDRGLLERDFLKTGHVGDR